MEQTVVVAGVRNLVIDTVMHHIENTEDLTLHAFVEHATDLQPISERYKPDCILICPSLFDTLPEDDCVEFLQNHNSFNLLVVTIALEQNAIIDLVTGGVKGILLLREIRIDELLDAISTVALGQHYIGNDVARMLQETVSRKTAQNTLINEALTEREMEVSKLIADGLSSKEIARVLDISPTVSVHRRNIMMKLGVNKATALAKLVHGP